MAVRLGNIEPVDFRMGSKQVEELRLGEQLVWKRRLIEGVDYQRYDWLRTNNKAYINIGRLTNEDIINTQFKQLTSPTNKTATVYGYVNVALENSISFNASLINETRNSRFGNQSVLIKNVQLNKIYTINHSKNGIILNGVNYAYNQVNSFTSGDVWIFDFNNTNNIGYNNRELHISQFVVEGKKRLYPCQLSRDIPANLDSQGVARQAGTCGMIEELTGIFYTNANTTGSFSVFND